MATYECSKCGMGVNGTYAKCDAPLVDDMMKLDEWKRSLNFKMSERPWQDQISNVLR